MEGAWVAFYSDWSDVAVFADETAALREAVDRQMSVVFVPWGSSVRDVANKRWEKTNG